MPSQTRCPSCSAAVPPAAAWCSLCHAELRERPRTSATAVDVVPSAPASHGTRAAARAQATGPSQPAALALAEGPAPVDHEPAAQVEAEPVGRHARREPAPEVSPEAGRALVSGRHAAGAPRLDVLEGVELPAGGDVSPEELDALADQMLTRLAIATPRDRFLDPADVPGGKWTLVFGAGTGVALLLLALFTVLGLVLDR